MWDAGVASEENKEFLQDPGMGWVGMELRDHLIPPLPWAGHLPLSHWGASSKPEHKERTQLVLQINEHEFSGSLYFNLSFLNPALKEAAVTQT